MAISENRFGFATFYKEDGLYYFQFNDSTGEPIFFSHGYQSEKSRDNGIQVVIRNAGEEEHYERKKASGGQYYFILKSGNHQEIGRSRKFSSEKEREEKLTLLKAVNEEAPVYQAVPPLREKEAVNENHKEKARREEAKKMPRHKFSIIYYPDSDVWRIIHDLSGDSRQFGSCNGQLIQEFLEAHLPAEKEQAPAYPERPAGKNLSPDRRKEIQETIDLIIRNAEGEEISNFATTGQFREMEVLLKEENPLITEPYDAEVKAKSLEDNRTIVIGKVQGREWKDQRVQIPLSRGDMLQPGMYRITVSVDQPEAGRHYAGSKLIMLDA